MHAACLAQAPAMPDRGQKHSSQQKHRFSGMLLLEPTQSSPAPVRWLAVVTTGTSGSGIAPRNLDLPLSLSFFLLMMGMLVSSPSPSSPKLRRPGLLAAPALACLGCAWAGLADAPEGFTAAVSSSSSSSASFERGLKLRCLLMVSSWAETDQSAYFESVLAIRLPSSYTGYTTM